MANRDTDDLSTGQISDIQREDLAGKIEEEKERRIWKTRLLHAYAAAIPLFYAMFLAFVFFTPPADFRHTHIIVLAGILAGIPTLLVANFTKLVKTKDQGDDMENSPLFMLLKELIQALKK